MYAIINTTTQSVQFYTTQHAASEACRAYNVLPDHSVYIVDFVEVAVEQL
jgi:hypothetical protein